MLTFASCDKSPTEDLEDIIKEDLGYVPKIATFTLLDPASTDVQPGTDCTFDLRYWSEGQISDIQFYLIIAGEETQIGQQDYVPAYSEVTRTDSLIFNYQIPASLQPGTSFSIQARVTNQGLEQYPAMAAIDFTIP